MAVPGSSVGQGVQLKTQLRALLERHNLTAAELARRSGVPKQVLSLWLAGVEPRKLSHLKRVAQALGVSVDELCFGLSHNPSVESADWIEGTFIGRIRRITTGMLRLISRTCSSVNCACSVIFSSVL